MSDKPIKAKPGMYAIFYENLKQISKDFGYNLVIHGSLNRDLDLIAIPWVDNPRPEIQMIQAFDDYLRGLHHSDINYYSHSILPGGRNSYIINLNRGDKRGEWNQYDAQYYLDISVTPLMVGH
jgi:hypothetical protein